MLKGEYTSFQYMVVYIAVMQVSPLSHAPFLLTTKLFQGALGTGRWLSHSPSMSLLSFC